MTAPAAGLAESLPPWAVLVRAPNPGVMTLDGTNSWILRAPGATGCVVVDPGPDDAGHLNRLADHGPIAGILLTHHHADHSEAAARFAELTGAWVRAADERLCVGGEALRAGQTLRLAGLRIRVLATPGHTRDSLSFVVDTVAGGAPAVLSGDTILGRGSTVVGWPDGDLRDYLASLEALRTLGPIPVLPGHGPPLTDCAAAATTYLEHRRSRLEQVRHAVAGGARTAREVVDVVYQDIEPALRRTAEAAAWAQLAYLGIRPERAQDGDPAGAEVADLTVSRHENRNDRHEPAGFHSDREHIDPASPLDRP